MGWDLACESWTFDGKFHQEKNTLSLTEKILKSDPVDITSLPYYPLSYAHPEVQEKLRCRGETFWKFRKPVYVTYNGLNTRGDFAYVSFCSSKSFKMIANARQDQARFLIDPVTWKRSQEGASALKHDILNQTTVQPDKLDEGLMLQNDFPSAEFPYLVPENIVGFSMQDKKWGKRVHPTHRFYFLADSSYKSGPPSRQCFRSQMGQEII